jgi:hypothetical protein
MCGNRIFQVEKMQNIAQKTTLLIQFFFSFFFFKFQMLRHWLAAQEGFSIKWRLVFKQKIFN